MVRRMGFGLTVALAFAVACKTAQLSDGGSRVATSQSAPIDSGWEPESCKSLGYIVGRGGGAFGGGWIANEELITYAMNDLRNQAANLGANFVQHDSPTMGQSGSDGSTTTTTATVSGTAYRCEQKVRKAQRAETVVVEERPQRREKPACVPGATQECVGPGGCRGGQYCLDDGTRYSRCDCGEASEDEELDEAYSAQ